MPGIIFALTMKKFFNLSIVSLCAVMLIFGGCSNQEKESLSFEAMDTFMNLTVYGKGAEEIKTEILKLDSLLSPTKENSDIFKLNRGKSAAVDKLTAEAVKKSLEACEYSNGALDVTVYPVISEWGFISGKYKIPSQKKLDSLLKHVDYKNASVNGNKITLKNEAQLDMGAVAKGFAADKAVALLKSSGAQSAILNLGGTIAAYGKKPGGDLWKVGVADPENSADYVGYVSCSDKTVATSGSYERFFEGKDGKIYSHIIDPKTGYPVDNGIDSVTIVSDIGVKSDALSTALFVMGQEKAVEFWRANRDFEFVILTKNTALVSEGLKDSFTLSADKYAVKNID